MAKEPHTHAYNALGLARITKIDNEHYPGSAGDKSFLMRVCACKNKIAFEMGATDTMRELLEKLRCQTK